jgi:acyl carrier protein
MRWWADDDVRRQFEVTPEGVAETLKRSFEKLRSASWSEPRMIRDAGGSMGLDTVELVIEVEKAFDIAILDADAERIATVGQSSKSQGWDRQEVWECLRAIIVTQLGVAPEDVVESASFVNDLGAG